jgi:hypothetical protein
MAAGTGRENGAKVGEIKIKRILFKNTKWATITAVTRFVL